MHLDLFISMNVRLLIHGLTTMLQTLTQANFYKEDLKEQSWEKIINKKSATAAVSLASFLKKSKIPLFR